jgi:hypothetical protein
MAIRETRLEPTTIERIQRHRKPRRPLPPDWDALAAVRQVVRESDSVEHAIAAVKAIEAAWKKTTPATRHAIGLLITVLELSDTVESAAVVFPRLARHYPVASHALESAREHLHSRLPDGKLRLVPGDEDPRLGLAFLEICVPADDYAGFKPLHDELVDWWLDRHPDAAGIIDIHPRRTIIDV